MPFLRRIPFALLFFSLTLAGCDWLDDNEDDTHGLDEVERLVLRMNGADLVVIENNQLASGQITVAAGEESPLISLRAFDHDGDVLDLDALGSEYRLTYDADVIDQSVATFEQHDGERWSFHVHGEAVGTTVLELELLHGDHADFVTPAIPVVVTAAP